MPGSSSKKIHKRGPAILLTRQAPYGRTRFEEMERDACVQHSLQYWLREFGY